MIAATILKKLIATDDDPIRYQLYTDEGLLLLNDFIGKEIKLEFSGKIFCKSCGRQTKKNQKHIHKHHFELQDRQ